MNAQHQKVKENLISQFKECNTQVTEWEKSFIAKHGTYPDPEDIPEAVAIDMQKGKRISRIARHK